MNFQEEGRKGTQRTNVGRHALIAHNPSSQWDRVRIAARGSSWVPTPGRLVEACAPSSGSRHVRDQCRNAGVGVLLQAMGWRVQEPHGARIGRPHVESDARRTAYQLASSPCRAANLKWPRTEVPPTEITSIRHTKDTRMNIPTEELRDFVAEDEKAPKSSPLSARSVARSAACLEGQGRAGPGRLEVPVVPIYIQEKIHPQALIENLRETAKAGERRAGADAVRRLQRASTTSTRRWTSTTTTSTGPTG